MSVESGLRVLPGEFESLEEYLIFLRHLFAYELASTRFSNTAVVLEAGCGEGYGTFFLIM